MTWQNGAHQLSVRRNAACACAATLTWNKENDILSKEASNGLRGATKVLELFYYYYIGKINNELIQYKIQLHR